MDVVRERVRLDGVAERLGGLPKTIVSQSVEERKAEGAANDARS